jgi:hypothetical protein
VITASALAFKVRRKFPLAVDRRGIVDRLGLGSAPNS